jgi:hypothetical protein
MLYLSIINYLAQSNIWLRNINKFITYWTDNSQNYFNFFVRLLFDSNYYKK